VASGAGTSAALAASELFARLRKEAAEQDDSAGKAA
jgi:hypothetical protein